MGGIIIFSLHVKEEHPNNRFECATQQHNTLEQRRAAIFFLCVCRYAADEHHFARGIQFIPASFVACVPRCQTNNYLPHES